MTTTHTGHCEFCGDIPDRDPAGYETWCCRDAFEADAMADDEARMLGPSPIDDADWVEGVAAMGGAL